MFESKTLTAPDRQLVASQFMSRTYGWMFVGLLVTATVSYLTASSEAATQMLIQNRGLVLFLMVAEVGVVLGLSLAANRISAAVATLGFLFYAALNGITFSLILQAYTMTSVTQAFLVASGMFGGMALYGTVTRKDLTGVGSFMMMGVWGLILVGLVNMFFRSEALSMGFSLAGVVIFTGLAAWDAQKIKAMAVSYSGGGYSESHGQKLAIFGALALYLDFINLFLSLLRLMGRQRD